LCDSWRKENARLRISTIAGDDKDFALLPSRYGPAVSERQTFEQRMTVEVGDRMCRFSVSDVPAPPCAGDVKRRVSAP